MCLWFVPERRVGWRIARRQTGRNPKMDGPDVNNGRIAVIRNIVRTALLSTALMTVAVGGALAKDTIVWWDFLIGHILNNIRGLG